MAASLARHEIYRMLGCAEWVLCIVWLLYKAQELLDQHPDFLRNQTLADEISQNKRMPHLSQLLRLTGGTDIRT